MRRVSENRVARCLYQHQCLLPALLRVRHWCRLSRSLRHLRLQVWHRSHLQPWAWRTSSFSSLASRRRIRRRRQVLRHPQSHLLPLVFEDFFFFLFMPANMSVTSSTALSEAVFFVRIGLPFRSVRSVLECDSAVVLSSPWIDSEISPLASIVVVSSLKATDFRCLLSGSRSCGRDV